MRLRQKIFTGFLILALMLFIAGVWTIYELKNMGSPAQTILDKNHTRMRAAKTMIEALESEDRGILLLLQGNWGEGREIIAAADILFGKELETIVNNITLPGEQAYTDIIRSNYQIYKAVWERPIVDTERQGSLDWYFKTAHESFLDVKSSVNDLMFHNNQLMFDTASNLREKANRSVMPGLIAIISALAFTFLFYFFVNYYFVTPIVKITESVKKYSEQKTPFDVRIETNDEIHDLAESINNLCLVADSRSNTQ